MNPGAPAGKPRSLGVVDDQEAFALVLKFFVGMERSRQGEKVEPAGREDVLDTPKIEAAALTGGGEVYEAQDGSAALSRFLALEGLELPRSNPAFPKLARLFQAAELEHTLRGIISVERRPVVPRDPLFRDHFAHSPLPKVKQGPTPGEFPWRPSCWHSLLRWPGTKLRR